LTLGTVPLSFVLLGDLGGLGGSIIVFEFLGALGG